jgi:hypothetical protein
MASALVTALKFSYEGGGGKVPLAFRKEINRKNSDLADGEWNSYVRMSGETDECDGLNLSKMNDGRSRMRVFVKTDVKKLQPRENFLQTSYDLY